MDSETLQQPVKAPSPLRYRLRNLLVMLLLMVLFAECVGLPHVRTSRGYWSITGFRASYTPDQPLVLLLPMPKHTWEYAMEYIQQ